MELAIDASCRAWLQKSCLAGKTLGLLVSYRPLAESRAQYVHFGTVWDNLLSVHKYLKRSSDPLFIPWSRARRGRRGRWAEICARR